VFSPETGGTVETIDFLVIGSGIAGLRAALVLAPAGRVTILTKAEPAESNTRYAQGGIAVALGSHDSPGLHEADTLRAGDGLCDEEAVRVLVHEGPRYVTELVEWGTGFERDESGQLAFGREAAHSVRRVLHAGDATGREISRALWERVAALPSVTTIADAFASELIVERGVVKGARFFDAGGEHRDIEARATLLATGGAGQVFRDTTNPSVAIGDGIAMAYHAGARLADLEFVQFHPTALNRPDAPRFLLSEALRGEGARLINERGEPFMLRYHPGGDLAPRDVVARSIVREQERVGGLVYLTLAHLDPDFVHRRFPTITETCQYLGLDLARDLIPVGPAAHYMMGGVDTDEWGRTSLPGLFAAGEVACTGVHGANRLASNSLLEGLVFGARAGVAMQEPAAAAPLKPNRRLAPPEALVSTGGVAPDATALRDLMWRAVGLFRRREGLREAVALLDEACLAAEDRIRRPGSPRMAAWHEFNLATVARLIAQAALRREESRGGHARQDFPARNDRCWKIHMADEKRSRSLDPAPGSGR
jgi:L-aspartate oxidase